MRPYPQSADSTTYSTWLFPSTVISQDHVYTAPVTRLREIRQPTQRRTQPAAALTSAGLFSPLLHPCSPFSPQSQLQCDTVVVDNPVAGTRLSARWSCPSHRLGCTKRHATPRPRGVHAPSEALRAS